MVKYLQIDTANNGNVLVNLEHVMFVDAFSLSVVRVVYSNAYQDLDQVKLLHPADADANSKIGSMSDAIRKLIIDAAKGRWSEPVVNITGLIPKPITSMILD